MAFALFSGYEGALRVPFVIRWSGKIEAGRESDEIVHEMDLFHTLAKTWSVSLMAVNSKASIRRLLTMIRELSSCGNVKT